MEDVRTITEKLFELYSKGKTAFDNFSDTYKKMYEKEICNFVQTFNIYDYSPIPQPDYSPFRAFTADLRGFYDDWHDKTMLVLKTLNLARYSHVFENPREMKSFDSNIKLKDDDPDEVRKLKELLDLFNTQLDYLYKVANNYEEETLRKPIKQKPTSPTYNVKTKTLSFAGKDIKFTKRAKFAPKICAIMFDNQKSREKLWRLTDFLKIWDETAYYAEITAPKDWNKVYEIIKRINLRVQNETEIKDLFLLKTKSVKLNPDYL